MRRILVVDDHEGNCLPLVKLFTLVGMEARYKLGGEEALDHLVEMPAAELPHLILLDLMMPEVDGFEVLRQLRGDRRFDAVVVLVYTAVVDAESHRRAVQMGAQGYVLKGRPFEDLRAEVRRHLPAA